MDCKQNKEFTPSLLSPDSFTHVRQEWPLEMCLFALLRSLEKGIYAFKVFLHAKVHKTDFLCVPFIGIYQSCLFMCKQYFRAVMARKVCLFIK